MIILITWNRLYKLEVACKARLVQLSSVYEDVFETVHYIIDIFHLPTLMHNLFIHFQYLCYITILDMFRAVTCPSSGGQIVLSQHLYRHSLYRTVQYTG